MSIFTGDCRIVLPTIAPGSIQTCVTSPPYWGLRDYGVAGQLGLEATPVEYVDKMVQVFREVRRVLKDDGTLWLNLGDSYVSGGGTGQQGKHGDRRNRTHTQRSILGNTERASELKPKDLCGIPWRVAFALQADGWYLRQDIIWSKPNPTPESVRDRCTKSHEYLFLLSKRERYYFDAEAISEPLSSSMLAQIERGYDGRATKDYGAAGAQDPSATKASILKKYTAGKHSTQDREAPGRRMVDSVAKARVEGGEHDAPFGFTRNKRSVWTIVKQPYAEAHFATFPTALVEPCILAGSKPGDTVLDPFFGSGAVGQVAEALGRQWIGVDLNPNYERLSTARTSQKGLVFDK